MYRLLISLALPLLFLQANAQNDLKLHRPLSSPVSRFIRSFEFVGEPQRYPGTGSDMHWWTWGADGRIYVVDDDGKNFDGPSWYAHLLSVKGIPPNHIVETVNDFQFYDFRQHLPNDFMRRYVCGPVAVDSLLYLCIYDYDWNIPGKALHPDTLHRVIRMFNPWRALDSVTANHMGFVDAYSRHGGVAGIIRSADFGKTWTLLPNEKTQRFFPPAFGAPAFLTFGPGNRETPKELQPYIYAISNDGSWASGDRIYLGRVHRDSVAGSAAWSFFGGMSGSKPQWVRDVTHSIPVLHDPGHAGHPTITYNKYIRRYILAVASDVFPHKENASQSDFKKWNWASELQLYESEYPWGPWNIFYNDPQWGGTNHTCYLLQLPAAWISDTGLEGHVLFSGDYVNRKGDYYGFMTQGFRMQLFQTPNVKGK